VGFDGVHSLQKIGRAVRFSASEIESWAKSKSKGSVEPLKQEGHEGATNDS